nr:unnamed protein product [Digitaria exilis]
MHHTTAKFSLLIVAAAAWSFLSASHALPRQLQGNHASGASCLPHERDALLAFKNNITSDPQGILTSWQRGRNDNCCRWMGVSCSNQTGHVLQLDLRDGSLIGQISPSLLSLEHLEYLDLSTNDLSVTDDRISQFLFSFKNLRHLDLSWTQLSFTRRVPDHLGNLSTLEYLDLSGAYFLPREVPPQFGNLSNLRYLGLDSNHLYSKDISWLIRLHRLEYLDMRGTNLGSIDNWLHVVNMIPSLKYLLLSNCSLPRAKQSLTHINLTALEMLDISQNYFGQPIASCWFWNLEFKAPNIEALILSSNNITGPVPETLCRVGLTRPRHVSTSLRRHRPSGTSTTQAAIKAHAMARRVRALRLGVGVHVYFRPASTRDTRNKQAEALRYLLASRMSPFVILRHVEEDRIESRLGRGFRRSRGAVVERTAKQA